MARKAPRKPPRGAGKPGTPGWLIPLAVAVPAAVVLLWLFWAQLSAAAGPTLIPALSPVLPRPEGAPKSARANWTSEDGVTWTACEEVGGGALRARWIGEAGFDGVVVAPGARCAQAAWSVETVTVRAHGQPLLLLAGPATSDRAARTAACQGAADRGLAAHLAVARAARDPGRDVAAALRRLAAEAPALKYARAAPDMDGRLACYLRSDPPAKPGEVPTNVISATMSR